MNYLALTREVSSKISAETPAFMLGRKRRLLSKFC